MGWLRGSDKAERKDRLLHRVLKVQIYEVYEFRSKDNPYIAFKWGRTPIEMMNWFAVMIQSILEGFMGFGAARSGRLICNQNFSSVRCREAPLWQVHAKKRYREYEWNNILCKRMPYSAALPVRIIKTISLYTLWKSFNLPGSSSG